MPNEENKKCHSSLASLRTTRTHHKPTKAASHTKKPILVGVTRISCHKSFSCDGTQLSEPTHIAQATQGKTKNLQELTSHLVLLLTKYKRFRPTNLVLSLCRDPLPNTCYNRVFIGNQWLLLFWTCFVDSVHTLPLVPPVLALSPCL